MNIKVKKEDVYKVTRSIPNVENTSVYAGDTIRLTGKPVVPDEEGEYTYKYILTNLETGKDDESPERLDGSSKVTWSPKKREYIMLKCKLIPSIQRAISRLHRPNTEN